MMHLTIDGIDVYLESMLQKSGRVCRNFNPPVDGSVSAQRTWEKEARDYLIREVFGVSTRLLHDGNGAPSIEGYPGHISISHCRNWVGLAVSSTPSIGIDIEHPRDTQLERVRERFVSPHDSPTLSLLHLWTAKEAVYKAAATPGLTLASINVTPSCATLPDGRVFHLYWHKLPTALLCVAMKDQARHKESNRQKID